MNILYKKPKTFIKMCSVCILIIIHLTKNSFICVGSSHKNYTLLKGSDKK